MARSVATIQAQIIAQISSDPNLVYTDDQNIVRHITYNTSHRALWRAWTYVIAVCIAIVEQLMDIYLASIETLVSQSAAASQLWIQAKMFEFQYDATNPQIIQLINTIPQYPIVDATKRIITACAVSIDLANNVNVKVAKGNTFVALDPATELPAAQAYINIIGDAGINYNVISLAADKLYIKANVYYQGQYSAIIQTNVITALNNYLQNLSITNFDGSIKMSDLENVIRQVTGVTDVVMVGVIGRPDSPTPSDPTNSASSTILIQNQQVIARLYNPKAGYMVQETVSGYTFADTLIFIAQ